MEPVDNNQFEVKPTAKNKRKLVTPGPNVYLNPALDLLVNDDPICNTAMEIVPSKKRKRAKSCDVITFENTALDLGVNKAPINDLLLNELENVRKNVKVEKTENNTVKTIEEEPIYANLTDLQTCMNNESKVSVPGHSINDMSHIEASNNNICLDSGISILDHKSTSNDFDNISAINPPNTQTNVINQVIINNTSNLNLSFIDRLALDSPIVVNESLNFDDDLNESNIMEIKTITIITKKKRIEKKKNTNPFLDIEFNDEIVTENPFLPQNPVLELEYNEAALNPVENAPVNNIIPRRLFANDTQSTITTIDESTDPEYENVELYRQDSPIYENIDEKYSKQSKILGQDISHFTASDIMNINQNSQTNLSNDSNDSKNFKHFLKVGNKLSKKVMKTLKKTFKSDKSANETMNPYEVPRKPIKKAVKESGIENLALNLDMTDDEEDDPEHQYETIKTIRNTQLNMNVTPLKERNSESVDSFSKNTPGKKVRFDSTLNREKVITGDSFQSPGFDEEIYQFHNELENCINERKFLQQNM